METADPTKQLQDAMRRDTDSHLVCERCGAPVQYGWVSSLGLLSSPRARRPRVALLTRGL